MKKYCYILFAVVTLYTGVSKGERNADISTSALSLDSEPYSSTRFSSSSNLKRGFLEENKIAIGTILESRHFDKYDYHDYQESHNGVYLNINKWSTGTYRNSADVQSIFITYNPNLYRKKSFLVNLVAGVANGYDGWEHSQGDYMPLLGVSAQWTYLKTIVSYDAIAFGLELPLN